MTDAATEKLETLGLWGDGDELAALRNVEKHFGVTLNQEGAGNWFTFGDIYTDLLRVLPHSAATSPETWRSFAIAIAQEAGADPAQISPETRLIDRSGSRWLSIAVLATAAIVGAAIAFWPA